MTKKIESFLSRKSRPPLDEDMDRGGKCFENWAIHLAGADAGFAVVV